MNQIVLKHDNSLSLITLNLAESHNHTVSLISSKVFEKGKFWISTDSLMVRNAVKNGVDEVVLYSTFL